MNQPLIYVGDRIIDLQLNQVVATTIQRIEIGDISKRKINRTNTLKAVTSENNSIILGNASSEYTSSSLPHSSIPGKMIQNGIEIMRSASIIVNEFDGEYKIDVLENLYDYFKLLEDLNIQDVDCITNSAWTPTGIDAVRNTSSGIISAIINWGKSGVVYDSDFILPSFFYHTLVTKTLDHIGLVYSGSIFTDARFTDLIIPYGKDDFKYPLSKVAENNVYSSGTFVQTGVTNATHNNLTTTFTLDKGYSFQGTISINVSTSSLTLNDGTYLRIEVLVNSVQVNFVDITGAGTVFNLTYTQEFDDGDTLVISATSNAPVTGVNATIDAFVFSMEAIDTVVRTMVNWNYLLPDISCEDLLKDFFTRFALIHDESFGTLYLESIEDIINDRANAIDWSDKVVNQVDPIDYKNEYAETNYFEYALPDESSDISLGRGQMTTVSTSPGSVKTLYTSPFSKSNTKLIFDGVIGAAYKVGVIPVYIDAAADIAEFENSPGLRLMTIRSPLTYEYAITFNATPRSDFKVGYFVDSSLSKDTGFQYFIDQFYSGFSRAIYKNKVIGRKFNLNEIDIYNYSPFKIVWDGRMYSIVNMIDKFVEGKITNVQLFKVS